eukprot:Gb_26564 [translate_table: standard]
MNGSFPTWIVTQYTLKFLDLSDNNLVGGIPSWIWDISSELFHVNLSQNHLEGSLTSIQVSELDVSFNKLSGRIPLHRYVLHRYYPDFRIEIIYLNDNNFIGEIPPSLGNRTYLCALDISNNYLRGNIPLSLADCPQLFVLNLANNQLEGNVPEQFGRLQYLQSLRIQDNKLSGSLPRSITNCSWLQVIDLRNNAFTGTIPSWIGNFSDLQVLITKLNTFDGRIPLEIGRLRQLRVLDISSNYISGSIPKSILNFTGMTTPLQYGDILEEFF